MTSIETAGAPPWAQKLLTFALSWTVFLGTGMGIVAPGFAASMPNHAHETLNGVVPFHIDQPTGSGGSGVASCATANDARPAPMGGSPARVACASGTDAASGSASLLAAIGPLGQIHDATFALAGIGAHLPQYAALSVLVLTPPPRA